MNGSASLQVSFGVCSIFSANVRRISDSDSILSPLFSEKIWFIKA